MARQADAGSFRILTYLSLVGISVITPDEADKLALPTLPIPGTEKYLIELDVFHELHCLNRIRKVFYPERFGDKLHALMDAEGNVNRTTNTFRHWGELSGRLLGQALASPSNIVYLVDHCIDTIRQSLMCHADVAPVPFHIAEPPKGALGDIGIYPRLTTMHSCRNYNKVKDWALAHRAPSFKFSLTPEEAQEIKENAGFDQSAFEDLSEFSNQP